jgi:hypothetical protein
VTGIKPVKSDDDLRKVLSGSEPMNQVDWPERVEELDILGCHFDESGCPSWYANEAYGFLRVVPLMDPERDILPIGEPLTDVVGFIGIIVDWGNVDKGIVGETVFKCVAGKSGWLTRGPVTEPADKEWWWHVLVTGSDHEERIGKIGGITFIGLVTLVKGVNGPDVVPATNVGNVAVNGACCLIVEIGGCMTGKTTGAGTGKAVAAAERWLTSLVGKDKGLSSWGSLFIALTLRCSSSSEAQRLRDWSDTCWIGSEPKDSIDRTARWASPIDCSDGIVKRGGIMDGREVGKSHPERDMTEIISSTWTIRSLSSPTFVVRLAPSWFSNASPASMAVIAMLGYKSDKYKYEIKTCSLF